MKNCKNCNILFKPASRHQTKYCSVECGVTYRNSNRSELNRGITRNLNILKKIGIPLDNKLESDLSDLEKNGFDLKYHTHVETYNSPNGASRFTLFYIQNFRIYNQSGKITIQKF